MPISRRHLLVLLASTGLVSTLPCPTVAGNLGGGIRHGWDENVPGPTKADFFVAPAGDDTAPGSFDQPLRTIQRGVDMLAARKGGSLGIRGGIYREQVSLDALRGTHAAPYRIHRYGQERVTITAAEPLTGWRPASAMETSTLGLPSGVFAARLDPSRVAHKAVLSLNLYEGDHPCTLSTDRADYTRPQATGDYTTYRQGTFLVDSEDRILAIQDKRLVGMDPVRLTDARVRVYHAPNLVSTQRIEAFDPATGTLTLSNQTLKLQRSNKKPQMRYALENLAQAMQPGDWAVKRTSAGLIVYLRPRDPTHIENGIEVSLRPVCIDVGAARHVELFGLEAIRASGEARLDGICIRVLGNAGHDDDAPTGLRVSECRVGESPRGPRRGFGAIYMRKVKDVQLRHITMDGTRCGLFINDGNDVDMRFLHVSNAAATPTIFYSLRNSILAFSLFENSGSDAHSNKFNFYQGSDAVLVYGVRCRGVSGYATYQKASRIHFAFCDLPCDPRSNNRALVSQNFSQKTGKDAGDGTGEPVEGSTFYYWNNTLAKGHNNSEKANALRLGPERNSQNHAFFNNILHGGGLSQIYTKSAEPKRERRSHNRYTGLSWWQTSHYNWHLGPDEEQMRPGQKPRGKGLDMRPVILSEIAPLFPKFTHWDLDIEGQPVDWDAPPIGCLA
ncbi:hypothetical protein EOK75_01395 [Pseudorhodobacter turbinis]|uniref:Right handed beta helix domain-containing protein n=1 Tax=Pseudorhodobacter turbinis TaxID=2500533 RepID=A0A4P8ECX5_9RHOB|nr:hypothetical protein [Pseudorhodobacter turbinis]QCO54579.1 hypothetical protein EOK75_01395 [Pseudorhodobacter turbinis]